MIRLANARTPRSIDDLAGQWLTRLKKASTSTLAGDLYLGRSIVEAKKVAAALDAALYVASAGVGLVRHTDSVPFYDLTVSGGESTIAPILKRLGAAASDWWSALNRAKGQAQPLSALVELRQVDIAFLALPSSYIELISDDLATLRGPAADKLRIFTSTSGARQVPGHLQRQVMPYDERLESLPAFAGTRTEFPQRAMRHFINVLNGHRMKSADAYLAVAASMSHLAVPQVPERVRQSDDQIKDLLRKNWETYQGNSARLLRFLRDDALVACEQSRFRSIWQSVKTGTHL